MPAVIRRFNWSLYVTDTEKVRFHSQKMLNKMLNKMLFYFDTDTLSAQTQIGLIIP